MNRASRGMSAYQDAALPLSHRVLAEGRSCAALAPAILCAFSLYLSFVIVSSG